MDSFRPQFLRTEAIQNGVCALDETEHEAIRNHCLKWLHQAFAGNSSATAREISGRTNQAFWNEPLFDSISVKRTDSNEAIVEKLKNLKAFLVEVLAEVTSVTEFEFPVIHATNPKSPE